MKAHASEDLPIDIFWIELVRSGIYSLNRAVHLAKERECTSSGL
jgi:hypothetical protein